MSGASRQAPAVGVRCAGGRAWRAAQALLVGLAAGGVCLWLLLHLGAWPWPALGVAALAAAWAWRAAAPRPVLLQWDGAVWSADGVRGSVQVTMDLGGWLLLRFQPAEGAAGRWLPLAASEAGPARHALRAALYSRALQPPTAPARRSTGPD